jgi:hypothetical protein
MGRGRGRTPPTDGGRHPQLTRELHRGQCCSSSPTATRVSAPFTNGISTDEFIQIIFGQRMCGSGISDQPINVNPELSSFLRFGGVFLNEFPGTLKQLDIRCFVSGDA